MNTHIIYKLIFPNNKIYIGQTKRNFNRRMNEYLSDACNESEKNKNYNKFISNAIRKYGWGNVKKEILFTTSEEFVDELETMLIAEYNSADKRFGYNIESGGHKNKHHSEETKKKISKSKKGNKLSEKTKEKISKALKGKNHPLWGKTHSNETILKMKKSHIGKKNSKESILKMKKSHIGKKGYWTGKQLSEETKKKKSESMKLYWKNLNR